MPLEELTQGTLERFRPQIEPWLSQLVAPLPEGRVMQSGEDWRRKDASIFRINPNAVSGDFMPLFSDDVMPLEEDWETLGQFGLVAITPQQGTDLVNVSITSHGARFLHIRVLVPDNVVAYINSKTVLFSNRTTGLLENLIDPEGE